MPLLLPESPSGRRLVPRHAWRLVIRRVTCCSAMIACTLCAVSNTHAQQADTAQAPATRAEAMEAARRAKARQIAEPPHKNKVEAVVDYIEDSRLFPRVFNPPRGWFAQVGGLGEGNGLTMGGGYRQPTDVGVLSVRALGSFRESSVIAADLTRNFLPRDAGFVTLSVARRHEAAQRFFGSGPDSHQQDRTGFGLTGMQAELTTGVRVTRWLTGTAGVGFLDADITATSENVPRTNLRYGEPQLPGVLAQPDFVTTQVGAIIDTRATMNPRRGALYQAHLRRFSDREGGRYSFTSTRVDLQHFIPFWNETRLLAVRVMAEHADGLGDARVPFYLQPTLGGARSLRGYSRQRFRDRSALLFSAEYRYEVNPFIMGAVFYDAGQVAPDWSDFRLKDLRDNYGVGIRFGYSNAVALRADVAFGGEDPVRLVVGFSTSF